MFYIEKSTNTPRQKYILGGKNDLFQETKAIQMIIIVWRIRQNSQLPKTLWGYTYAYLKDSKEIFQETNY